MAGRIGHKINSFVADDFAKPPGTMCSSPVFDSPVHDAGHGFYGPAKRKTPTTEVEVFFFLWTLGESNSSPPECKTGALPNELRARDIGVLFLENLLKQ
jgi:hypothetical protein